MNLSLQAIHDVTVLSVSGRFDAGTAPLVRRWLLDRPADESSSANTPPRFVVDLEEAIFVDSTAMAILVQATKRFREQGGDLRLCGLRPPVRYTFERTRLDKAIEILPDRAAAVAAFARASAAVAVAQ
jgi:anti-sigma B factor antagonist